MSKFGYPKAGGRYHLDDHVIVAVVKSCAEQKFELRKHARSALRRRGVT